MFRHERVASTICLLTCAAVFGWEIHAARLDQPPAESVRATLLGLPLSFEPNQGQADSNVRFIARGNGYLLYLTAQEVILAVKEGNLNGSDPASPLRTPPPRATAFLRMSFPGSQPAPTIEGFDSLPGVSNYYLGNDRRSWHTGIPHFSRVRYRNLYPGIDLVLYGNPGELEYDLEVAPGADPASIGITYQGASIRLDQGGDLLLTMPHGTIRQKLPRVYQRHGARRDHIEAHYDLDGNVVRFRVAEYDHNRPLILDPVIVYSTYLGGTATDDGLGIALDAQGNAFVVGYTESVNFPTASPILPSRQAAYDGFVTKINPSGTALVFSTYFGGDGLEWASSAAVDSGGNVWVTGQTGGGSFPLLNAIQSVHGGGASDITISRLNSAGQLLFSTLYGGGGDDNGVSIATDSTGVYVAGFTSSQNFPVVSPLQPTFGGAAASCGSYGDGYVIKLSPTGSTRLFSTYLGGSSCDIIYGLAVDADRRVVVVGQTFSSNFPTRNPIQGTLGGGTGCTFGSAATACPDAFVAKLNAAGTELLYSTFLGGQGSDIARDVAVDSTGAVLVTGDAASSSFPLASPLQPIWVGGDAFLTKVHPTGARWIYSTFLGGSAGDNGWAVSVDSTDRTYVSGFTSSTDFPLVNAIQTIPRGGREIFVATVDSSGAGLHFSTLLGGSGTDWVRQSELDAGGNLYLLGRTDSPNFPLAAPLYANYGGNTDAFVVKMSSVAVSPIVNLGGVVNNASFAVHPAPVAPGSIAAVFGKNLNDGSTVLFSSFGADGRLVTSLGGASVKVNGIAAPMFYSTPGQLGIQIPLEVAGSATATVEVTVGGQSSLVRTINLASLSPGLFTLDLSGSGPAAVLHQDGITPVTASSPARRGEVVIFYGTGMGPTTPALGTGLPSSGNLTATAAIVTIDGIEAQVEFSGTAPGCVGLNQLNVRIPNNSRAGSEIPVVLSIGGKQSNAVTIAIAP